MHSRDVAVERAEVIEEAEGGGRLRGELSSKGVDGRGGLRWLHALKVRDDPRHMERRLYGDCHVRDNVLAVVLIYIIVN
jgi:hypothetical protein